MSETLLEMRGISKYFDGVRANYNIDFEVKRGEVHALLGENGAGKSTLMNILFGLYEPTDGEIFFEGRKTSITSPRVAIDMGIGMVHQHFMLIPALTVIENVVLGIKGKRAPFTDLKGAGRELVELAARYHIKIDPFQKVSELSVGQQQRLEILKALYRGAKLLILDEPTAVLTPQEVEELFHMIRVLIEKGNTVIFITHKLNEVFEICDSITVLRQGAVSGNVSVINTTRDQLAQMMVGKKIDSDYEKIPRVSTEEKPVLKVNNLVCQDKAGVRRINNLSIEVCAGEVLGICGVDGNGQKELVDAITGIAPCKAGKISFMGEDITKTPALVALKRGLTHIPEDRHKRGVVLGMNLVENILLMNYYRAEFSKHGLINWKKLEKYTDELIDSFQVKTPGNKELMKNLSGGNQQKVVLGREIMRPHKLLIAMHPARGLDVGATDYIHRRLIEERNRGVAILLVSTELDEIFKLSDKIAVIYEGEIMGVVSPQTDIKTIGLMMGGLSYEEAIAQKN